MTREFDHLIGRLNLGFTMSPEKNIAMTGTRKAYVRVEAKLHGNATKEN